MTTYASVLDRLTADRKPPKNTDRWALKATDFAGRTRGGFQWPNRGWVEASGPFTVSADPCPSVEGDGLCVATTYSGLASGRQRALCLLLVAYSQADVLAERDGKVRVKRARVVELRGADLSVADLSGAYLSGANLRGRYDRYLPKHTRHAVYAQVRDRWQADLDAYYYGKDPAS